MNALLLNNRYQILETLGRGGFGVTFLAVDTHMPSARKCVIKQLKPSVQSPEIPDWLKQRFQREAAILEQLGEENAQIPRLYAYFTENDDFYLVQEWIEGDTLTQVHRQRGNLPTQEVKSILMGVLPVLDYLHNRSIIHRDIKPDNIIMRASDGKPVLIDFGIVKEAMASAVNFDGKTAYSVALGTPGYMAPEQGAGRPVYSSDLYSLALTAVFLLTGKTPQYLATDPHNGEILWRKELTTLHSHLTTVLDRALRFHPRDRFASAKQMLAALQASSQANTAATIVVAPKTAVLRPKATTHQTAKLAKTTVTETDSEPSWLLLILGSFLVGMAIFGGLLGGFLFATKERSRPTPSPSPAKTLPSPAAEREDFPVITSPQPPARRFRRPQVTPTPTPEASPTPTPQLTPIPEATPTPQPEATVPTEPTTPSTPQPETTVPAEPATPPSPSSETTFPPTSSSPSLPNAPVAPPQLTPKPNSPSDNPPAAKSTDTLRTSP